MTRNGRCEACGAQGPVLTVRYLQNTGMLIMRQSRTVAGELCRGCSGSTFTRMTLHTFFLGWWGMISFVLTPIFLLNNLWYGVQTLRMPSHAAVRRDALEGQREYALNLLATKDRETVVEVLSRTAGVSAAEADAFLRTVQTGSPAHGPSGNGGGRPDQARA
jgi:hypothetical protein